MESILDLVGQTPMVRLKKLAPAGGAEIWAKLEYLNPGGSVKDRAALGIVLDAERRGVLRPGATIVEATAGNTGIGLALIGVNRGYKVMLYVPQHFSEEKCMLMRGLGATVVRTPEAEGMAGAIRRALEFEAETEGAFAALQFENPANPDFHEQTTAVEVWEQMEGRLDACVGGGGSAGPFTGVGGVLEVKDAGVLMVAVGPQGSVLQGGEPGSHRVEGIGGGGVAADFC
ncbi:cysteine synthase family protein, partial [Granulicella sp. dw_53]|uniref:PLP-dependent cysteine synthase family protein n=1 Tax=Granulicella sp. dw_53 TaxID=2719792 RepID=UPI0031F67E30